VQSEFPCKAVWATNRAGMLSAGRFGVGSGLYLGFLGVWLGTSMIHQKGAPCEDRGQPSHLIKLNCPGAGQRHGNSVPAWDTRRRWSVSKKPRT